MRQQLLPHSRDASMKTHNWNPFSIIYPRDACGLACDLFYLLSLQLRVLYSFYYHNAFSPSRHQWVGSAAGNPGVCQGVPIPIPVETHTHTQGYRFLVGMGMDIHQCCASSRTVRTVLPVPRLGGLAVLILWHHTQMLPFVLYYPFHSYFIIGLKELYYFTRGTPITALQKYTSDCCIKPFKAVNSLGALWRRQDARKPCHLLLLLLLKLVRDYGFNISSE